MIKYAKEDMICVECGGDFKPKNGNQIFCKPRCKNRFHDRKRRHTAKRLRYNERYKCENKNKINATRRKREKTKKIETWINSLQK
jgi:recombination DNA repair RAD52 pathway protein